MILIGEHVVEAVALALALTLLGQLAAWLVHKYTLLGAFNLYPLLGLAVVILAATVALHVPTLTVAAVIAMAPIAAMTVTAGRRRMHALGAGGDLRTHELERRWIWQPAPARKPGERLYLDRQGEIVRRRPWSDRVPYVSMTDQCDAGPRLPLGQGQHVFLVGATGSGKTTTARRLIAARVLAQQSSLVVLDQKGDLDDVAQMRRLAAAAGVPFVLFDAQDPTPIAGSRCGVHRGLSPLARPRRSRSQSLTTTPCCASTSTSSARCCTPPTYGHHRSRI